MKLSDIGLVLEGGGMRGIFTIGVLDCFMDNNIEFPYIIGVSAGCSNGLCYASKQRGRNKFVNIDALIKYRYISYKYLFTQHCVIDYRFLFEELPKKLYPFDFDAYMNSGDIVVVATNCQTGKAQYFQKPDTLEKLMPIWRASCSLPYGCPIVEIDNIPYLDGGISDAIPLKKSIADGNKKNIVILTRNEGFVKKSYYNFMAKLMYRKYPNFIECLKNGHIKYNQSLAFVEEQQVKGDVFIIRPKNTLIVDRLERRADNLTALYDEGYNCALSAIDSIKAFAKS